MRQAVPDEVGPIEGHLDEAGLRIAHLHDAAEGSQQGVCHVVGKSPECEETGDQHKRYKVLAFNDFHNILFRLVG